MSEVRVGVIGCGSIAQLTHFPSIAAVDGVTLVGVADTNAGRAKAAAARWGAPSAFTSHEQLLDTEGLDAVIIASPNAFHFEQAHAALQRGIHVYVEKPMTCTNAEAWALVREARERSLTLTVGCNQRFWLQHEWAKQLIDQGVIGEVKFARSSLHETWHLYQDHVAASNYRVTASEAVSGTLFDQGSHRVDLVTWLVGGRPSRVVGVARNVADRHVADEPIDDLAVVMIEMSNGAIGLMTSDKFSPVVSNITEIYGTEGTIFASSEAINPFQTVPLAVYSARDYNWETLPSLLRDYRYPTDFWVSDLKQSPLPKRWTTITPPREWSFTRMMNDFLTAIREGRPPLVSGEDGAHTMEVLCGVFRSMETGGWVDLPMPDEVIPPYYHRG